MAATYFVVFGEGENASPEKLGRTAGAEGKTLASVKTARFVKMEAENVADAQAAIKLLYPGDTTNTPVVVAEAAWKTS